MFIGSVTPIARGDAIIETVEIGDDDTVPYDAALLSAARWQVRIRHIDSASDALVIDAVTIPHDGVLQWSMSSAQTRMLEPGSHTLTLDAHEGDVRTRILEAILPVSED